MLVRSLLALVVLLLLSFLVARRACAEPWFDARDRHTEDRFLDGDLDSEDLVAHNGSGRSRVGAGNSNAKTWLSVVGFYGLGGASERVYGAMAVVGIALDRIAVGPTHRVREWSLPLAEGPPTHPLPTPDPAKPIEPSSPTSTMRLTPRFARNVVTAAWRAAGLGVNDARIDAMISRAHWSALLPETRLRAMRLVEDHVSTTSIVTDNPDSASLGANLWLEARLTWHFDRLLYADDEPTLERVRIERQDARARIAAHVMEALILWQRALLDAGNAPPASRQEQEATLREIEAAATLDVLTGGWFTLLLESPAAPTSSPP